MTASRKSVCASGRYISFSTRRAQARRRRTRRGRTRSANATADSPCPADPTTGRGTPSRRCSRYGAATRIAPSAIGSSAESPRNSRQSSPPRNRMPNAIATMTTNAPKSGSISSSRRSPTMTANSGAKPRMHRLAQRLLGVQQRGLAHRVARRVEHDGELHELGRLHVEHAQREPAARAVDVLADAGDQHDDEQHRARRRTDTARASATPSSGPGKPAMRQRGRPRRTPRGARGSTRRDSRCARDASAIAIDDE